VKPTSDVPLRPVRPQRPRAAGIEPPGIEPAHSRHRLGGHAGDARRTAAVPLWIIRPVPSHRRIRVFETGNAEAMTRLGFRLRLPAIPEAVPLARRAIGVSGSSSGSPHGRTSCRAPGEARASPCTSRRGKSSTGWAPPGSRSPRAARTHRAASARAGGRRRASRARGPSERAGWAKRRSHRPLAHSLRGPPP
jgi:hypothetical protein